MAVEAHLLDLFSPQLLTNRELMNPFDTNSGPYVPHIGYGVVSTTAEAVTLPTYGTSDHVPAHLLASQIQKPAVLSVNSSCGNDNGYCYLPLPSRKRSRDSVNSAVMTDCSYTALQNAKSFASFSFLGSGISPQILQQQHDLDRLIAIHMERVKLEIEEKIKRRLRTIMEALEQRLMKRLKAKEEERVNISKLNHALVERVKSLCVENQIWRDLAQTNEATVKALRINLEQVLLAQETDARAAVVAGMDENAGDAQSACGSNFGDDDGREISTTRRVREARPEDASRTMMVMCGNCGEEESCVLLLPCRHLCLCATCGSHRHTCPVCKSPKDASVHVNKSS